MTLVIKPTINWLTLNEALAEQSMGAVILDVRMPSQFIARNAPGSINLPLPVLRKTASILNSDKEYIIYSDNGIQSIIASFLLTYRGIKAKTIKGPIQL
jgi:rhodanese-related sulfurtransferase